MTLRIGPVSDEDYLNHLADHPASFPQCPSWPAVKIGWAAERLAWRDEQNRLVGVGLVLLRSIPLLGGSIAVLAEGPVLDWSAHGTLEVLAPLAAHLRHRGAVGLRVGPDVVVRRWHAATVKQHVGSERRLRDIPPDVVEPVGARLVADLLAAGWSRAREGDGLYGSTRHSFHVNLSGRTPEQLLAAMNQQWRRGIRKAEKAGVVVEVGGLTQLTDFHRLYVATAQRDGFRPHPLDYFQRMWSALCAEDPGRIRLYLARHEGEVLAAMIVVRVGGLAGYAYGGSAAHKREVYPSNAVHWRILCDLLAEGAALYDMRGVCDGLDPDQQKFGVLRFKVGTGGDAVENVGDWELALRPVPFRLLTAGMHRLDAIVAVRSWLAGLPRVSIGGLRRPTSGRE